MTIDPKEVNKVVDRNAKKKPTRKPAKSINELPIVKKKLADSEKKVTALKKASMAVVVAARTLAKLSENRKAK